MRRGAELFRKAIDLDSSYAAAWTGLAEALAITYDYGFDNDEKLLVQAEEAIRRALEIDPESGDAHAIMGVVHYARQDGRESILSLNRAVLLQPSNADAHSWLSWGNALLGNASAAIESGKRAVAIDPLAAEAISNLALSFLCKGLYEQALSESRHALQLLPDWPTARLYEGTALYHLGHYAEAQRVLTGLTVEWASRGASSALALTMLAQGDAVGVQKILATLERSDDPYSAGLVHAALGDYDAANQWWIRVEHWNAWASRAVRHQYPEILRTFRDDPRNAEIIAIVDREWGMTNR
jgi:tetratricopeptide (TPR) repeat protein